MVINHDPLLSRTHLVLVLLHSHHFGPQAGLPRSPLPSGRETNGQRPVAPPARTHSSSSGVADPLLALPVNLATKL